MAVNTMEYASIFMDALDAQLTEGATSGWMEANAGQVQYSGGSIVKIPKISLNGLGKYDRNAGFAEGAVTLNFESRELTQDRGRTFQLDAIDVDETNFAAVAGNVMGEFQRTKVIPEIDAYRYSTIARLAQQAGKASEFTPSENNVLKKLMEEIIELKDAVGDSGEVVVTMSAKIAGMLDMEKGGNNLIDSGEFHQGDAVFKVRSIDGSPIIRVPSARLKTAYEFYDGISEGKTEGGFIPTADAKNINWILAVRQVPIAVSKTDVTRIFDPLTNQNANAWKIDYRKYHDLWIPDNGMEGIRVSIDNA